MRLFCLLINISHLAWTTLSGIKSRCYLRPGGQWSASTERRDSKDFLSRSFQFPSRRERVDCGEIIKTDFTGRDHIVCHRREIYHNHWHCLKLTHLAASNIDCSLELQHFIQKWFFSKNEFENVGSLQKCESMYIKLEKYENKVKT